MNNEDKHISHELLISYLLGETNNAQINEVEKWLQLSEENMNIFLKEIKEFIIIHLKKHLSQ